MKKQTPKKFIETCLEDHQAAVENVTGLKEAVNSLNFTSIETNIKINLFKQPSLGVTVFCSSTIDGRLIVTTQSKKF